MDGFFLLLVVIFVVFAALILVAAKTASKGDWGSPVSSENILPPGDVVLSPEQQQIVASGQGVYMQAGQQQSQELVPADPTLPVSQPQPVGKPPVVVPGDASILGRELETGNLVFLTQDGRRQGLYCIGVNGTGKSTLIASLILQDAKQGLGVCLLDPHGDLTKAVISRLPENRLQDVILLTLQDPDFPFGLNIFECPDPSDLEKVALTAGFVMHVFAKTWGVGNETPLLAQVLRNVTFTLIQNPGTTIAEIPLLLQDATARGKLIANVKNNQVKLFWNGYNKLKERDQQEKTSSTLNKVDAFLTQPMIANIVGQSKTSINFREIMDSGKILLVQLSPRLEDMSALVGAVVIGQLLNAAFSRADLDEDKRKQFNLYADEYQRYATEDFATLLSEARKYRLATCIGHQYLDQLDEKNKGAASNAANMVVFRVTGEDGVELSKNFDTTPPPPEVIGKRPVHVPVQDVITHLLQRGHVNEDALAFNQFLAFFRDWIGEGVESPHYGRTTSDSILVNIATNMRNRARAREHAASERLHAEMKIMLHDLNRWFNKGMQTRDTSLDLPHDILLTVTAFARSEEMFPDIGRNEENIALLCSSDPKHWDLVRAQLYQEVWSKKKFEDQWRALDKFLRALRTTFAALCQEPVLVDSGRWEDVYDKPRTYADVQNEIATRLANQKNYIAKVKTEGGEYTIKTIPLDDNGAGTASTVPSPGGGGRDGYAARLELVREQTRKLYCRSRLVVEEEVAKRHEALMQGEESEPPKRSRSS